MAGRQPGRPDRLRGENLMPGPRRQYGSHVTHELASTDKTVRDGAVRDSVARDSQEHWRRARGLLNVGRHELARSAQDLYPAALRVAGTGLIARPEWLAETPVPLDQVTLSWQPDPPAGSIDGTEPHSEAVRPLREAGNRFGCYAAALGALSRPGLFEDRACYRLLEATASPDVASLGFGPGRYFDSINTCEAVAHEYAAATLARDGQGWSPAMSDLPLRSEIGDPTDLARRPVMVAICTLVLRADRAGAAMILHWRDPAQVASGGGMYQVAPVGVFQPSHDAEWNQANDFSLWRCIVRELSEELLGAGEDYRSDIAPIDYERWPLHAKLAAARRAGTLRVYWLGLGVDPLSLAADMLSVAVLDAGLFDATFAGLVGANEEGRIVTGDGAAGEAVGVPFKAPDIERFTTAEPMQPAGAALLRIAWEHRDTLLAG
jgi:hypothetical protein